MPLLHTVHDAEPVVENLPASQEVQFDAPSSDHLPPSHFVHALLAASEKVPLLQTVHVAAPAFE